MQVPRSTYHAARRRAYAEGWIRDRYVPDPSHFGLPFATFLLARPFADRSNDLSAAWAKEAGNVLAWVGAQVALGVFFHESDAAAERMIARFSDAQLASSTASLVANLRESSVPVYFDYEGLWAHLTAIAGTIEYPHGLGGSLPASDDAPAVATRHQRWAATELVQRPFDAAARGGEDHLVGPFGLPFSELKLLRQGWVGHRVLLNVASLPPYRGRRADQIVFVHGELKSGARPEELFAVLTRECRVYPFLYATQSGRLLIGALGGLTTATGTDPEALPESRRPVMSTLQGSLRGIEILQESAAALTVIADHRYDRILPRPT